MAGSKSDYLENAILDHILGGPDYSRAASVYVALYTTTPADATTGSGGGGAVEVSGGSYARVAVTNNATNFPAAASGQKKNGTDITFPTATGNWGTVVAFAILDSASGGQILYWGSLSVNKTISTGDTAKFATNDITITED